MFVHTKNTIITVSDLQLVDKIKTKGLYLRYKSFEKMIFFDHVEQRDEIFDMIIICLEKTNE